MSDRKLLELAALAAGIKWKEYRQGYGLVLRYVSQGPELLIWDPINSDGDALRLAIRLNIDIMFFNGFQEVICGDQGDNDDNITEPYGEDIQAAVRRCIVRAAAEIGRSMP